MAWFCRWLMWPTDLPSSPDAAAASPWRGYACRASACSFQAPRRRAIWAIRRARRCKLSKMPSAGFAKAACYDSLMSDVSGDSDALILVDEADVSLGFLSKTLCHEGRGVLHRAFSLLIFNEAGDLLIQQR